MQKVCSQCGESKPLEDFRFNQRTGRFSYKCVECWTPCPQVARVHRSMRHMLAQRIRDSRLKKNGKRRHRELENVLTIDEVMTVYEKQGGLCAITGVEMTHAAETPQTNASIDRIDTDKGYTLDNIRLVCTTVNVMRMRLTDEELGLWSYRIAKGLGHCR